MINILLHFTSNTFYGTCNKCPRKNNGNIIYDGMWEKDLKWRYKMSVQLMSSPEQNITAR